MTVRCTCNVYVGTNAYRSIVSMAHYQRAGFPSTALKMELGLARMYLQCSA